MFAPRALRGPCGAMPTEPVGYGNVGHGRVVGDFGADAGGDIGVGVCADVPFLPMVPLASVFVGQADVGNVGLPFRSAGTTWCLPAGPCRGGDSDGHVE